MTQRDARRRPAEPLTLPLFARLAPAVAPELLAARIEAASAPDDVVVDLPVDRAVAPDDVATVRLPMALRGYRMAAVDDVLDRLGAELALRDERIRALEDQLRGRR